MLASPPAVPFPYTSASYYHPPHNAALLDDDMFPASSASPHHGSRKRRLELDNEAEFNKARRVILDQLNQINLEGGQSDPSLSALPPSFEPVEVDMSNAENVEPVSLNDENELTKRLPYFPQELRDIMMNKWRPKDKIDAKIESLIRATRLKSLQPMPLRLCDAPWSEIEQRESSKMEMDASDLGDDSTDSTSSVTGGDSVAGGDSDAVDMAAALDCFPSSLTPPAPDMPLHLSMASPLSTSPGTPLSSPTTGMSPWSFPNSTPFTPNPPPPPIAAVGSQQWYFPPSTAGLSPTNSGWSYDYWSQGGNSGGFTMGTRVYPQHAQAQPPQQQGEMEM